MDGQRESMWEGMGDRVVGWLSGDMVTLRCFLVCASTALLRPYQIRMFMLRWSQALAAGALTEAACGLRVQVAVAGVKLEAAGASE